MPFVKDFKNKLCRMGESDSSIQIIMPDGQIIPGINEIIIKESYGEYTTAVITILLRKPEFKE